MISWHCPYWSLCAHDCCIWLWSWYWFRCWDFDGIFRYMLLIENFSFVCLIAAGISVCCPYIALWCGQHFDSFARWLWNPSCFWLPWILVIDIDRKPPVFLLVGDKWVVTLSIGVAALLKIICAIQSLEGMVMAGSESFFKVLGSLHGNHCWWLLLRLSGGAWHYYCDCESEALWYSTCEACWDTSNCIWLDRTNCFCRVNVTSNWSRCGSLWSSCIRWCQFEWNRFS